MTSKIIILAFVGILAIAVRKMKFASFLMNFL